MYLVEETTFFLNFPQQNLPCSKNLQFKVNILKISKLYISLTFFCYHIALVRIHHSNYNLNELLISEGLMKKHTIILIEDEEDIASLIQLQSDISGFRLLVENDGINGYLAVERERPDLVILDIMLPGQNGLDVCKKIKSHPELKSIPVIILSAKGEELDVILGLELGADDYVTKPFSPKVLFSRVKAVLRRAKEKASGPTDHFSFGSFHIDFDQYTVKKSDALIPLTLSEFSILKRLIMSSGQVLTRNQLLDELQNDDAFVIDRNVDVHVASLRKKLGPNFKNIATVRGVGYRFLEDLD